MINLLITYIAEIYENASRRLILIDQEAKLDIILEAEGLMLWMRNFSKRGYLQYCKKYKESKSLGISQSLFRCRFQDDEEGDPFQGYEKRMKNVEKKMNSIENQITQLQQTLQSQTKNLQDYSKTLIEETVNQIHKKQDTFQQEPRINKSDQALKANDTNES